MKKDNIYNLENASIEIDLNGFDCGNSFLDKDFGKLLQKDKYPTLKIYINQIALDETMEPEIILPGVADFVIGIAGVNNCYNTKFYSSITNGIGLVEGELELSISDFNLTPPKKLLGLVKVSEEILIEFRFLIYKTSSISNYKTQQKLVNNL